MDKITLNELIKSGVLPKIHTSKDEEGSILVEWIFLNGARIGLNIEKNKKESGWHVISKQITASGPLYEKE